jgi:hypothetical protein
MSVSNPELRAGIVKRFVQILLTVVFQVKEYAQRVRYRLLPGVW